MSTDPAERGGESEPGSPANPNHEPAIAGGAAPWPGYEPLTLQPPPEAARSVASESAPSIADGHLAARRRLRGPVLTAGRYVLTQHGGHITLVGPYPTAATAKWARLRHSARLVGVGVPSLIALHFIGISSGSLMAAAVLAVAAGVMTVPLEFHGIRTGVWEISDGMVTRESTVNGHFRRSERHSVDRLEIVHNEWAKQWMRKPNGSSDWLRVRTRDGGFVTLAGIEFDRKVGRQNQAGMEYGFIPIPWDDEIVRDDTIEVVGDLGRWTGFDSMSPTILMLSTPVRAALYRPLVVVVGTCRQPTYNDGGD